MRFRRRERCRYTVTDRKRAAAARSQQRQRDALPLLARLVAEQQPSIETVMLERIAGFDTSEQARRDRRARDWCRARRAVEALSPDLRCALLSYWNNHRWLPGDPAYLLDLLHGFEHGRLLIIAGTVRPARITIDAADATALEATSRKPIRAAGWDDRRTVRSTDRSPLSVRKTRAHSPA